MPVVPVLNFWFSHMHATITFVVPNYSVKIAESTGSLQLQTYYRATYS